MSHVLMRRMLCILILFASLLDRMEAQTLCTYDDSGCTAWAPMTGPYTANLGDGCYVDYAYDSRICNGVPEFRITSMQASSIAGNNCDALLNITIDQFELSALMEKLDQEIIRRDLWYGIPTCGYGTKPVVKIYSASCGAWVKCSWWLEPGGPECDPGYSPVPEVPVSGQVDSWSFQPCGVACCKRTYTVCHKPILLPFYYNEIVITQEVKERTGDCSQQPVYGTNPCLDGC